jgi:hypothetical protein
MKPVKLLGQMFCPPPFLNFCKTTAYVRRIENLAMPKFRQLHIHLSVEHLVQLQEHFWKTAI